MLTRLWNIDLSAPPDIRQMGVATHGQYKQEIYRNLGFWSLHAYTYHARLRMGDEWITLSPGVVSLAPPGVELEYHYRGRSTHVYAHFNVAASGNDATSIPPICQLQHRFDGFQNEMREAVGWRAARPARAQSRLWELLWELSAQVNQPDAAPRRHPILDEAVQQIELRLGEPMSIHDLAARLDVSHAHLVRLFTQHLGVTPLRYVRSRRAMRAKHLLQQTTLPMKSIVHQIGVGDLQQFNKLIRRELGRSPRQLRAEQGVRSVGLGM